MEIPFEFDSYHVLLAATGAGVLLAYWCPRLVCRVPPAASALLMTFGMAAYAFLPGMPEVLDPRTDPDVWEAVSEIVVIVVLFATGLRIDDLSGYRLWLPTIRLLAVTMPLTIAAVALLGWGLAGMTVAGAIMLGSVLAPTDPVLAGDVQVGPPLEGEEHPVRFALTTEAGLNDGLAFPFVYLALLVASGGGIGLAGLQDWLLVDVLYRLTMGAVLGAAVGWVLGKALFAVPGWNVLATTGPGVMALAGVLFCYGVVELAEGYGFIGVFVAGIVCRRAEAQHSYHQRLHVFCESIEHAITAILLVLLGSTMPSLWPELDWRHAAVGLALLLVVRPAAGLIALAGTDLSRAERAVVACYGVRGIGSVYYLGYASGRIEFINGEQLWALVVFTIFGSTVLHGLTARAVVARYVPSDRPAR